MKQKFIRILSPITLAVIAVLDIAVLGFGIFAVEKLINAQSAAVIFFAVIEVFAIIVGFLVTREILKNGVIFYDDEFEFNGLDDKNIFTYENIKEIETYQDTSASLSKNFVDRHALIIITANDGTVTTVDIGLTTKNTLKKIKKELERHIDKEKIK